MTNLPEGILGQNIFPKKRTKNFCLLKKEKEKDGWMDGWKEGEEIKNKKAKNHKCISNAAKISKVFL